MRETLSPDAEDGFCGACQEQTVGNPLLLCELVHAIAAEGLAPTEGNVSRLRELRPSPDRRSGLSGTYALERDTGHARAGGTSPRRRRRRARTHRRALAAQFPGGGRANRRDLRDAARRAGTPTSRCEESRGSSRSASTALTGGLRFGGYGLIRDKIRQPSPAEPGVAAQPALGDHNPVHHVKVLGVDRVLAVSGTRHQRSPPSASKAT